MKHAYSTIPWPQIAGMRHKQVHHYGRTKHTIVHRVVVEHLPPLLRQLQVILVAKGPPTGSLA